MRCINTKLPLLVCFCLRILKNMPLSTSQSKVCFFFQEVKVSLSNRAHLKSYIQAIFKKECKRMESINYIFCSDKALLEINRQFLGHDFYTDIITFNLSESKVIRGEIYISIDRVRENAVQLGVSLISELHRVIFHGVLHLCGYKDKSKKEIEEMRGKEEYYLKKYGL